MGINRRNIRLVKIATALIKNSNIGYQDSYHIDYFQETMFSHYHAISNSITDHIYSIEYLQFQLKYPSTRIFHKSKNMYIIYIHFHHHKNSTSSKLLRNKLKLYSCCKNKKKASTNIKYEFPQFFPGI